MPTLVLVRHAETEPMRPDDHARRLTEAGREDCRALRSWLQAQDVDPELVLVSSAARAQETWRLAGLGDADPVVVDAVYTAGTTELCELVSLTPAAVTTLVVVGHNPTLERLAWELDDAAAARASTNAGLRPGGAAIVRLSSWDADHGHLVAWR